MRVVQFIESFISFWNCELEIWLLMKPQTAAHPMRRKIFSEERSMYTRDATKYARSFPVVECAQCGEALFAPEWTEHIDDRRVRHAWKCEACRYSFETTVCFPALKSA